jgi:hypothetical protein
MKWKSKAKRRRSIASQVKEHLSGFDIPRHPRRFEFLQDAPLEVFQNESIMAIGLDVLTKFFWNHYGLVQRASKPTHYSRNIRNNCTKYFKAS